MVDKNIIQSRFTKLGVVPIDNQHYLYATLDNNLIGIIVFIKTCDNHYYDEENIEVGKVPVGSSVSSSHKVELTEEEKNAARQAAIKRLTEEQYRSLKKRPAKKKVDESVQQMSLF